MENDNNNAVETALQHVIDALAHACLSLGKSYPLYDAASRSAFVNAVEGQSRRHGKESGLDDAAVAFLSGLDEDTVRQHRSDAAAGEAPASGANQLIRQWLVTASDADGRPNPLPLEGPLSFASLVTTSSDTIDARHALRALEAVGLARVDGEMVYLADAVAPNTDRNAVAAELCAGAFPLLAAIGSDSATVRTRTIGHVRKHDVPRLRKLAGDQLVDAQAKVEELLDAYAELDGVDGDEIEDPRTVSSGIFLVTH